MTRLAGGECSRERRRETGIYQRSRTRVKRHRNNFDSPVGDEVLSFLSWSALSLIVCSLVEYILHRWLLHWPRGGGFYHAHAVEHHARGMMGSDHTDYPFWQLLVALATSAPLWLSATILGCHAALVMPLIFVWWKFAHGYVHRAAHDDLRAGRWLCPWWRWCCDHHLVHHRRVTLHYAFLFPWTDMLFFTSDRRTP